jgi:hypothetical protein
MNALLSLLLQLLLLLSRDMDLAIERSDDGDDNAAIAKECGKSLIRCVASGFLPPSSFPLLPLFFSPLVAQVCKRKNKMKEKKERDLVGEMRKIPYLPTYLTLVTYLPTYLPTYLLTFVSYLPIYLPTYYANFN